MFRKPECVHGLRQPAERTKVGTNRLVHQIDRLAGLFVEFQCPAQAGQTGFVVSFLTAIVSVVKERPRGGFRGVIAKDLKSRQTIERVVHVGPVFQCGGWLKSAAHRCLEQLLGEIAAHLAEDDRVTGGISLQLSEQHLASGNEGGRSCAVLRRGGPCEQQKQSERYVLHWGRLA